jgi:3-dehydroquinate synthase
VLAHRPERGDILLALGGGVIGDMTGVAAALLLRGVDFVQCPTTLLAQVDSSVGGKTAVNTRYGKNLVGAFHQPRLVLCDLGTLDTLPARELRAGYAETVKYGLIDDPAFFAWCEANAASVLSGAGDARRTAVRAAVAAKARIVAADEREAGLRALLNLGHTFGHALEAETGFGPDLLHGEAVAIGMRQAFDFSAKLGLCAAGEAARVAAHLDATGLPTRLDTQRGFAAAALIDHMGHDKKVRDGKLTFVLARGIGKAFVAPDVDVAALRGFMLGEAGR